jgi:hypothetical protein
MTVPPGGQLFLGEYLDPATGERGGEPALLEAAELTTHGVVVGMTGSGKTGLGVVLVEEALLQGIPTIVLDPKGDLGNLLLTFPRLAPEDFAPWVEDGDPAAVAGQWRDGLAAWGIDGARVQALRDAAEFTIYTPGSTAGVPLDVVGSLRRPPEGAEPEVVADEVEGYVTGLLGMVGVTSDPLSGREHVLLANLIQHAWSQGVDLDLPALVGQVRSPPLRTLGVFELDAFFPPADRTALAMKLNGLLASPAFAAWAEGRALDIDALLRSSADQARPACAVVSLAHLADEERQFVVSLVLSKLITWMRRQAGSERLRVLVYFDEVLGFVPPNGAPPAKKPILTLFKQARAFGVGLVLATQNPVDVDYKGLSNAGTWMIGRLQTEQDRDRLLSGMDGDTSGLADAIAGLGKRQFVLRTAAGARTFATRWAMSYLRGPMTREQVRSLTAGRAAAAAPAPPSAPDAPVAADAMAAPAAPAAAAAASPTPPAPAVPAAGSDALPVMPQVAEGVTVRWLDPAAPWAAAIGADPGGRRLAPALVASVALLYDDDRLDLRHTEEWEAVCFPVGATVDPASFVAVDHDPAGLRAEPPAGAAYAVTDAPLDDRRFLAGVEKALADHLYRHRPLRLRRNPALKLASRVGEPEADFAARCRVAADAAADADRAAVTKKYATRLAKARDAVEAADDRVAQAEAAQRTRRTDTLARSAGSLLGAVFGGRRSARSMARDLSGMVGGAGRGEESARRVEAARNRVEDRREALAALEAELADELAALDAEAAADAAAVEEVDVPLEKSDVRVTSLVVAWVPTA